MLYRAELLLKRLSYGCIILALLSLFAVLVPAGCDMSDGPRVEPPGSNGEEPEVPPELDGGERQEPVLTVYIAEKGAIEQMPMEQYIEGVVAGEMEPDWPIEALAAQAIIARTFTLQKIAEDGGVPERDAHASTDIEEFQAYSAEDVTGRVKEAVQLTRGEVICHNNDFIRAWFSAYAGPRTALADEGLGFEEGNPPYIQVVQSPGRDIIPPEEGDWSANFSLEEVRSAVTETTGEDPGEVHSVEIKETGPSGRVTLFTVNGREISAPGLRLALDSTKMRSTYIKELGIEDGKLNMSGTGFGHGVGMCQWGARAMAERGMSPEEIVDYFYRDIDIISLWD